MQENDIAVLQQNLIKQQEDIEECKSKLKIKVRILHYFVHITMGTVAV